jgi:cytoskeletal protein CcmA (bactofilin family)
MGRSQKVEPIENQKSPAGHEAPVTPTNVYQTAPAVQPQPRLEAERPNTVSRAVSDTEAIARDIKEGIMSGFVGVGTELKGEANFKGMLRIDGHLTGRITSEKGTLIVSAGGQVDANVEVATARINGVVRGDIFATERIELGRTAELYGNIQTPGLVIEQGAVFEGNCVMTQARAAAVKKERAAQQTSARPAQPAANQPQVAKSAPPPPPRPTTVPEVSEVAS